MFKKFHPHPFIIWTLGLLLCLIIGVYIRVYPWRVALSSEAHEKASLLVVYNIRQQFFESLMQQNPSMPIALAQQKAMAQLNKIMHDNPGKIMAAIDKASQEIAKGSKTPSPTYLLESDPFYYYNLTENIAQHGHMAQTIKASKYLNPLMNAPKGALQPFTLHPYFGFYFYQILHTINPAVSLMDATALLPVAISCLSVILFFIIGFSLKVSPYACTLSAFIFNLAPIYLKRSAMGWYDTDPYNIFFTLLLLGLMVIALRQPSPKKSLTFGIAFGITITLFALIWQGWVMMFLVAIGCTIALIVYSFIVKQAPLLLKPCLIFLITCIITTAIGISACFGIKDFFVLFAEGFGELGKFTVNGLDLWPSLFLGVGELKRSNLIDFIQALGGLWVLGLGLIASVLIFIKHVCRFKERQSIDGVLIGALLLATIILSIGAERFILFMLIPLCLLMAIAADMIPWIWVKSVLMVFFTIALSLNANTKITTTVTPIFNPVWDNALRDINTRTPPDAIINTWWPPGHFIKAIARRGVIFDGATLSESAIGFWLAKALLSHDERYAQGIIRMINTSRNDTVDYLIKQGLTTSQAVSLIDQLIVLNATNLRAALLTHFNPSQTDTIINLLHGHQPHSYVLLYNEIIDDNLILSFTGNWDIKKIEAINSNPTLLNKIPKRGTSHFIDFCWSIAGGQTKTSPPLSLTNQDAENYYFSDGLSVNKTSFQATINSTTYGQGAPLSVVHAQDTTVVETANANGNLNYSILLYQQNGETFARLMDRPIANSMLMRLYYFNGSGLKFFKTFNSFNDLSNRTVIKTFEVNWLE